MNNRALQDRVDEWCRGDRQWTRDCRIVYAKAQLKTASPEDKAFWSEVLKRNEA